MLIKPVIAVLVALSALGVGAPAQAAPKKYANCADLNKDYPHGVARKGARDKVKGSTKPVTTFTVSNTTYNLNTARDRDKDGVACEKR